MTTIRSIITDAYRESGIIAVGTTPAADELAEALRRIQNLYDSLLGHELGEPLRSVSYGTAGLTNTYAINQDKASDISGAYVPGNTRLLFNIDEPVTLYLHPNPRPGMRMGVIDSGGTFATHNVTIDGNGRLIEGADSVVLSTNSATEEWFYRDDLGNWVKVSDLTANSDSPLPPEFDDFLITLLALRINPRYGAETHQETMEILGRARKQLRARYRQEHEEDSEDGLIMLPSRYRGVYGYLERFDRGR